MTKEEIARLNRATESALQLAGKIKEIDSRHAAVREPAPTGNGKIVLVEVCAEIDRTIGIMESPHVAASRERIEAWLSLRRDLDLRAIAGEKKYGTLLRTENGRDAVVDLYQEVQDAIMYAAQARMEGKEAGHFLPLLLNLGTQLADIIERRAFPFQSKQGNRINDLGNTPAGQREQDAIAEQADALAETRAQMNENAQRNVDVFGDRA